MAEIITREEKQELFIYIGVVKVVYIGFLEEFRNALYQLIQKADS